MQLRPRRQRAWSRGSHKLGAEVAVKPFLVWKLEEYRVHFEDLELQ